MRNLDLELERRATKGGEAGFTLAEVIIAIAITAIVFAGIITAYTHTTRRAEWSGYSLAAQALAIQQIEQARSAVWDPTIGKNEITNLNLIAWTWNNATKVGRGYSWGNLDLPVSGTNSVRATNFVTISLINLNNTINPPIQVQMMRVDTVWPFRNGITNRFFTNTVSTYFAPDNRDASTL